jgi:hypothetical protein
VTKQLIICNKYIWNYFTDCKWSMSALYCHSSDRQNLKEFFRIFFLVYFQVIDSFGNLNANDKIGIRDMILHHLSRTTGREDRAVMVAVSRYHFPELDFVGFWHRRSLNEFFGLLAVCRTGGSGAPNAGLERSHEGCDNEVSERSGKYFGG